jgi:hypothetical protein
MAFAMPSLAQPGWGGWGQSRLDGPRSPRIGNSEPDSREGKVQVEQFAAEDAGDRLGSGPITVTAGSGAAEDAGGMAVYEAAVVDQLVKAGYDTLKPDPEGGQVAEIRIVRDVLVPQESKRKPVSGEMTVGASNRGSMMGMAIAVDLTKPRKALVSTRLEASVKDRATGKPLWEGRAQIATRESDAHWTDQAIAMRLAAALFERFNEGQGEKVASH